jgi:hypothetical protein
MNESDARDALLVKAYEATPSDRAGSVWTEEDREWASRAALQVEGERASDDAFIARRARLAAERICSRDRAATRARRLLTWRAWVGRAAAVAALSLGILGDAIGPAQRINVLAAPLIAVIVWNLAVYVAIALRPILRLRGRDTRGLGPMTAWLARVAHADMTTEREERLAPVLAAFARSWMQSSARLTATRVARVLHTCAALLAAGTLCGMYVRGLVLEYRAGWESTFLDGAGVRAVLTVLLGPASAITGIPIPDAAGLEAIRFPGSEGEVAGPWIHLYAVTTAMVVLLPRTLLALAHWFDERRLAKKFPLPTDDPYFRSLARAHTGAKATVWIAPYSYHPTARAVLGLNALMTRVFGAHVEVEIAPGIAFGGEDAIASNWTPPADTACAAALFSLAATPEPENHGAFVAALIERLGRGTPLVALVDESAFVARFAQSTGSDARRRTERRGAWTRMLAVHGLAPVFVDLEARTYADAQAALNAALERAAAQR